MRCENTQKEKKMPNKVKIELEYILKTSVKALENLIFTPGGLSEWFADDVDIKEDIYTFHWDNSEETARLISKKNGNHIKWRWLHHEEDEDTHECYFEITYEIDPLTKDIILKITDINTSDVEEEDLALLWNRGISDLKRILGN